MKDAGRGDAERFDEGASEMRLIGKTSFMGGGGEVLSGEDALDGRRQAKPFTVSPSGHPGPLAKPMGKAALGKPGDYGEPFPGWGRLGQERFTKGKENGLKAWIVPKRHSVWVEDLTKPVLDADPEGFVPERTEQPIRQVVRDRAEIGGYDAIHE